MVYQSEQLREMFLIVFTDPNQSNKNWKPYLGMASLLLN